jgi:hypothetical protein
VRGGSLGDGGNGRGGGSNGRSGRGRRGQTPAPGISALPAAERRTAPENPFCQKDFPRPYSSRERTRTSDPVINSHLLYQLSYAGLLSSFRR